MLATGLFASQTIRCFAIFLSFKTIFHILHVFFQFGNGLCACFLIKYW